MGEDREKNSYVYEFDELNRMEKVYRGDGKWAEYSYDGTSARVGKRTGTVSSEETETTKYYNMGTTVLNEVSSNDGNTTNLIGAGIEARMSVTGSSITSAYFLQKNAHGDVTAAISGTERIATYDYDAFGNTLVEEGEINNPIRYSGEYLDEETGLIYLRARYYDPSVGRFISEDPIRDGMNWYAYCGNSPVMMVDPSGLDDYIIHGPKQEEAANMYEQQLYEANPETDVHKICVNSKEELVEAFNSMGEVDGKKVSIDVVIINVHGSNDEMLGLKSEELYLLETKEIDTLVLLTCNTGNKAFPKNIAVGMISRQNVQTVIAPDGYNVRYGPIDKNGNLIKVDGIGSDIEILPGFPIQGPKRDGEGYVVYTRVSQSTIKVTTGITQDGEKIKNVIDLIKMGKAAARGIFNRNFGSISTEYWDSY